MVLSTFRDSLETQSLYWFPSPGPALSTLLAVLHKASTAEISWAVVVSSAHLTILVQC